MQILSRLAGDRPRAGLRRVMILPVAAARAHMKPAVVLNLPDDFPDFHVKTSSRLREGFVFERGEEAFKNPFAVVAAGQRFASAVGRPRRRAPRAGPF
jgi:hypothetical protein